MASEHSFRPHAFQTDDPRLTPIYAKVMAGERLSAEDALALYRTGDILAVGWMANSVRERLHGDKTYFNVNRHINPTNVCVAACRLCAFRRKKIRRARIPWRSKRLSRLRLRDIPRRSRNFTLSADCIPTCHFNIFSTCARG